MIGRPRLQAEDVYMTCSSGAAEPGRTQLTALAPRVVSAASKYAKAAENGTIASLNVDAFRVADEVDHHLRNNYSQRMMRKGTVPRDIYDQIKLGSQFCVLCDAPAVEELDHYLPKSSYPLLSVVPDNLLPVCHSCNKIKSDYKPDSEKPALPHPYFDSFLDDPWLSAKVVSEARCISFVISPPDSWPPERTSRLRVHFDRLDLQQRLTVRAASEVATLAAWVESLRRDDRAGQLESFADSNAKFAGRNYWRAVMLRALAASEWYLDEGFRHMS